MTRTPATWDELRRIADEIQLKIHLAEMDARDRWRDLEPRITEVEHALADAGGTASETLSHELARFGAVFRDAGEDLVMRLHGSYMKGW